MVDKQTKTPKALGQSKSPEYCSFHNDWYRALALIARDLRIVLIVGIVAFGPGAPWMSGVANLLRHLV